jgi:hypothetical protein
VATSCGLDPTSGASGHPYRRVQLLRKEPHLEPNNSISFGELQIRVGKHGLTLLAIFIDNTTV